MNPRVVAPILLVSMGIVCALIGCDGSMWAGPAPPPESACTDGIDNDEDGLSDCGDPDCACVATCPCPEDCQDAIDNDADTLIDCRDLECPPCQEDCNNRIDDDRDGLIDCLDPSCPACTEICDNAADDDRDGARDCADLDCRGQICATGRCCGPRGNCAASECP